MVNELSKQRCPPRENMVIELLDSTIDVSHWLRCLDDDDCGAHAWFAGVTRRKTVDHDGHVSVTRTLHYQAHRSMALGQLRSLASAAVAQYDLAKLVFVHRLGEVSIGQASVLVGCSGAHRSATLASIPWIMDRLKTEVPIWKRETFDDDSRQWIHPQG